jgi:phage head maturation protease
MKKLFARALVAVSAVTLPAYSNAARAQIYYYAPLVHTTARTHTMARCRSALGNAELIQIGPFS